MDIRIFDTSGDGAAQRASIKRWICNIVYFPRRGRRAWNLNLRIGSPLCGIVVQVLICNKCRACNTGSKNRTYIKTKSSEKNPHHQYYWNDLIRLYEQTIDLHTTLQGLIL